jgi:NADH dehydrogenase
MKTIVIAGGGYGGIAVLHPLLSDEQLNQVKFILIDLMPFQGLKTEYYALAAGTVSDLDVRVAYPVDARLTLQHGFITGFDLDKRQVILQDGDPVTYDLLVISLGCTDHYHGIPGAAQYSASIQSLSATRITYQKLNNTPPYGQITIIGGGLSGVEIAAELRESRPDLNIRLLDRGPSILSAFPRKLQYYVTNWFLEHDVELLPHSAVSRLEEGAVYNGEQPMPTDMAVWTAGIRPAEPVQRLNVPKDAYGRVLLNEFYQIQAYPEVYVVGDCASLPFSPSAQLAEIQGKQVGEIIRSVLRGEPPRSATIKLRGVLGSLGKKRGFGVMAGRPIIGKIPRLLKSGVLWKSRKHWG